MEKQQLQQQVDKLAQSIEELRDSDPQLAERLEGILAQLQAQVDAPIVNTEPTGLAEQVDAALAEFELEHPTLSQVLADIALKLSSMGI